jgi:hypothetical protein
MLIIERNVQHNVVDGVHQFLFSRNGHHYLFRCRPATVGQAVKTVYWFAKCDQFEFDEQDACFVARRIMEVMLGHRGVPKELRIETQEEHGTPYRLDAVDWMCLCFCGVCWLAIVGSLYFLPA